MVAAVAKDGIELKAKARVTVRTNIDRLVGGAGEATVIARVGEGIVTTVGSSENHKVVLENPDIISRTVLNKGLDNGTAFEILSIDIADVDVGRNIGARLQMDQAEADKNIAQAKAAERRFRRTGLRTGNEGQSSGDEDKGGRGRGRGPEGHRRRFEERKNGSYGLLQPLKRSGRYGYEEDL